MNEVDARGLSCPEPVLLTAQALKSGSGVPLRVLVSEAYARQNVEKYAKSQGRQVSVTDKDTEFGFGGIAGHTFIGLHRQKTQAEVFAAPDMVRSGR